MSDISAEKLRADLAALAGDATPAKSLGRRPAASPIPASIGSARPKPAGAAQQSSGIAAPLTEVHDESGNATTRTYHPPTYLLSSNGLIAIKRQPVASLTLMDAMGRPVELVLAK